MKLNLSKKPVKKLNLSAKPRPAPKPVAGLTPETAYQGGKGWPSDRPVDEIIGGYKSFARLLESTADEGPHKKWLQLEVTAHTQILKMKGVADINIHE